MSDLWLLGYTDNVFYFCLTHNKTSMLSDFENVTGPVSVLPVHLSAKRWQNKQFSREKENYIYAGVIQGHVSECQILSVEYMATYIIGTARFI